MNARLRPCPFCGGDGELDSHIEFSELGNWYWIRCRDCKTAGPPRHTESKAIAAWNARIERTCKVMPVHGGEKEVCKMVVLYCCSECGDLITPDVNYCSNCGAKVVN